MARYQVILAYDGTDFRGFQRQSIGRTVQGDVEEALRQIGWQGNSILGAGRTDAGVHASGQVVGFDLIWDHGSDDLRSAINANLPHDVAVAEVYKASADFHPRYDAVYRSYRYHLYCRPVRDPLRDRFAWRVWPAPDVGELQSAAQYFLGEHDFASFGSPLREAGSTVRHVADAAWSTSGDEMVFEIRANAFLYHMVRKLVNFQIEIGQGKQVKSSINELLDGKTGEMVQGLAPPNGLFLVKVMYKEKKNL